MASQISNISQAFASTAVANPNISSERSTANKKDTTSVLAIKGSRGVNILPTPPNSISPNLPPQWRARISKEALADSPTISIPDSDIDLHDAFSIDLGQAALETPGETEDNGKFTPEYLAKFLTDILQDKGPLPVRHVMNHLTQVVPGFVEVPPAKARRLTTAALEARMVGELEFEKIGWGKWASRARTSTPLSQVSPRLDPIQEGSQQRSGTTAAISIPGNQARRPTIRRPSHGSWTSGSRLSARGNHTERAEQDMPEHDAADLMSIDGDNVRPRTESRRSSNTVLPSPLDYSDTDEEDWASMGAAKLRQGSMSSTGGRSWKASMTTMSSERPRRPSFTPYGRSMPGPRSLGRSMPSKSTTPAPPAAAEQKLDFTGVVADEKEQAAITALLRMGSYQG